MTEELKELSEDDIHAIRMARLKSDFIFSASAGVGGGALLYILSSMKKGRQSEKYLNLQIGNEPAMRIVNDPSYSFEARSKAYSLAFNEHYIEDGDEEKFKEIRKRVHRERFGLGYEIKNHLLPNIAGAAIATLAAAQLSFMITGVALPLSLGLIATGLVVLAFNQLISRHQIHKDVNSTAHREYRAWKASGGEEERLKDVYSALRSERPEEPEKFDEIDKTKPVAVKLKPVTAGGM